MSTIVALSSGAVRAGVAVIRLSGPQVRFVIEMIRPQGLSPRRATLIALIDPSKAGRILDRCIAVSFPGPASATGEDVLELHVHGSLGVVRSVLAFLTRLAPEIRLAEPGEFTRRALQNGKLDLLSVEALGDLLEAETERQVEQAQRLLQDGLGPKAELWRRRLIELRALVEADLDFSDEGDVPSGLVDRARAEAHDLADEMEAALAGAARGERMREGAVIAIIGSPNVGKSSLLNALAGRDMAIVSPIPGTTRDLLEAPISISGWPAVLVDTAGMRETDDPVEQEGVRRAHAIADRAQIRLSLGCIGIPYPASEPEADGLTIRVWTKSDLKEPPDGDSLAISTKTGHGLDRLSERLAMVLAEGFAGDPPLVTRDRQRGALASAAASLRSMTAELAPELQAELLRQASDAIGRLVGAIGTEEVLDRLFAGFCIGK